MKFVVITVIGCLAVPNLVSAKFTTVFYNETNFECTDKCWIINPMLEGHCYTSGNVGVPEGFKIRSIKPDPGFLCRFWAPREHGCGKPYQASAQINGDGMANTDEYEVAVNKYITRMSCRKG